MSADTVGVAVDADEDDEASACDSALEKNESLIRFDDNGAVVDVGAGVDALDVDDVGADGCCGLR